MSEENAQTLKVVKALRQRLPGAVTFKHTDMYTMGVPDFSVTLRGLTTWYEAKYLDEKCVHHVVGSVPSVDKVAVRPRLHVPAVQWETLRRLGRGYLVVYTARGAALTHVAGFRESVELISLVLRDLPALVAQIVRLAEEGKEDFYS